MFKLFSIISSLLHITFFQYKNAVKAKSSSILPGAREARNAESTVSKK